MSLKNLSCFFLFFTCFHGNSSSCDIFSGSHSTRQTCGAQSFTIRRCRRHQELSLWEQPSLWRDQGASCVYTKSLQSCPTLYSPIECSPPGSSVPGILQQEHWSGLPCPPPGDLPNPGIKPTSPASQPDSLPLTHRGSLPILKQCLQSLHSFCVLSDHFFYFIE